MSRPQGHSRAKVTTGPKPPTATSQAAGTRRSAGVLPGIARTASSLRQHSAAPGGAGGAAPRSTSSLPAHLRNLSTPRIPSPLGQGTPGRRTPQSFHSRTSKTTEKHVFLPEDPQLAPLHRSASSASLGGDRHGRPRSSSGAAAGTHTPARAHAGAGEGERSDAEKMTKREREEAGLSRLTAYDTAEGYRLKLLQAFLRREHGVGVVRVFDDCIYAVYNLPLLPGYGANAKVRSSPAVKSPGGVSMLERMTQAEEQGYDDEYFPVETDDPVVAQHDPSEYILSHSPPSPVSMREPSMDAIKNQEEEHRAEEAEEDERRERESHDIEQAQLVDVRDDPSPEDSQASKSPVYETSPNLQLNEDGKDALEARHKPPISAEVHHNQHRGKPIPGPPPVVRVQRRWSNEPKHPVAEAVFFSYGVSVFFGFTSEEEHEIMEDIKNASVWQNGQDEDDWEEEEFHYEYDSDAESPRIYNDMFTFKSRSHLFKLSLAHAIAQSTKLSVYETKLQNSLALTSSFPKELATTGHLNLDRKEALKMTGKLFKLRMDVNLIGGVLDTPELFWSDASLYPLYEAINQYLEIEPRVQVLNDRLTVVGDLLDIIHDYIDQRATHRITWVIIVLIGTAIVVAIGEVLARLVFHSIARDKRDDLFFVVATRTLLGIKR